MIYKEGVIVELIKVTQGRLSTIKVNDKIVQIIKKADEISKSTFGKEVVVTSLLDGIHSKNSLHYSGKAVDLRTWIYTKEQVRMFVQKLKELYDDEYDIIDEEDHIHIEYDPKR